MLWGLWLNATSTTQYQSALALGAELLAAVNTIADGADIVMAYARLVDQNGTVIEDTKQAVRFSVRGPAAVVGDDLPGANPIAPIRHGVAPALIRATGKAGRTVRQWP